ncbi:phage antirepressor N-terminal domain-containing protein [Salmonella enterica]|uniref:phage antirepressor N-terminal domain-containing protein n=1 Tax=Salmonella enterica TaxID=28901 RepID=UPI002AFF8BD9|nr:phage antirepressor N-terminal domain-containing protein [Salmonella enterica]
MTSISTINVPFHGDNLYVVNYNGQPYVPMKPIVEGMGLTWQSQFEKVKQRFKSTITEIVIVAADGKERNMLCLALRKLAGWLHTISPNKVKPEIRDKVIRYQEECDDVLYEYWTTGEVKPKQSTTTDDRAPLRNAVDCLMTKKRLPFPKAYKYVHAKYGVNSIDEVPLDLLPEAVDYIYSVALEGEHIPKQEEINISEMNVRALYSHMKNIVALCKEQVFPSLIMLGAKVETPLRERIETAACLAFALHNDVERKTK